MSSPQQEAYELTKVGSVGVLGTFTTLTLSQVATLVSISVGCATFVYVSAKIYFLFKNHGRPSD